MNSEDRAWPYDADNHTLNFRYLRPTDLPFNKRVYLPGPIEKKKELEIQCLKEKLLAATTEYVNNNKKNANKNLTPDEIKGVKSLTNRKDIVIAPTDKSSRFSVDTIDNYKTACQPHTQEDTPITDEEHKRLQKEMNAHSTFWARILRAGASTDNEDRVRNNFSIENHGYAHLYGLRKDHKSGYDNHTGPPVRPVCGANAAYNAKLSHLVSKLLRPIWKRDVNTCTNTEDLLASIRELNDRKLQDNLKVGSLDVKALYPSLDIEHTSHVVSNMFLDSDLIVEDIDVQELGLYLSINHMEADTPDEEIREFCPKRRKKMGPRPTITGGAMNKNTEKRYETWNFPTATPVSKTRKKMLATALRIVIKFIMSNHVYSFNNKPLKQSSGGAIGLELTGDLAAIYMVW